MWKSPVYDADNMAVSRFTCDSSKIPNSLGSVEYQHFPLAQANFVSSAMNLSAAILR